jgi:hypothetical protein
MLRLLVASSTLALVFPAAARAGAPARSAEEQPLGQWRAAERPPPRATTPEPGPSSTTALAPPPPAFRQDEVVVDRRSTRSPMVTIATDAAAGGLAGLLVGFGVALVDEFDDWDRNLMVGAGIGVLVGAAVGVAHAAYDAREERRSRTTYGDGMNRTDRDPVVTAPALVGLALRF